MNTIVYTVNLDGYDNLYPSPKSLFTRPDNFRYLYFTDGDKCPDGWELVKIPKGCRRESRYWKINSHLLPEHNVSIYLDASFSFQKPLKKLLEYLRGDMAICKHWHENVFKHATVCGVLKLDKQGIINKQVAKYPPEVGDIPLTENGLIIRKNNAIIKELNEEWWKEYEQGSCRDQISLPYAIWKVKPKITYFPFSVRNNRFLEWHSTHNKPRELDNC